MAKLVYLCGPISGVDLDSARRWRAEFTADLLPGIETLSPMRGGTWPDISAKVITDRDRFDTMRSDMIVANFQDATSVSIGSMIELGWADAKRIPIVSIMGPDSCHQHEMVMQIVTWVCHGVHEAADVVNTTLTPGL